MYILSLSFSVQDTKRIATLPIQHHTHTEKSYELLLMRICVEIDLTYGASTSSRTIAVRHVSQTDNGVQTTRRLRRRRSWNRRCWNIGI